MFKASNPRSVAIMMTAYGTIQSAVAALKAGAADYFLKPFPAEELLVLLRGLFAQQIAPASDGGPPKIRKFGDLVYVSRKMAAVCDLIATVGPSDATVLIRGETGTGKELTARAIHHQSGRRNGPLVSVARAAIPLIAALIVSLIPAFAFASLADDINKSTGSNLGTIATKKAGEAAIKKANKAIAAKFNKKLLVESRKNQCSFKSGTAELAPGCGTKSKQLANIIIEIKKAAQSQGQSGFKFIVSGHTDTTGDAAKNKELSLHRAQVMVKELISKGVTEGDIEVEGKGSEQPLVKPDDTPTKKAKNRRYEVQIRF